MSVFLVNPRYALHLWRQGLRTATDFLNWSQGSLVSRHRRRCTTLVNLHGISGYLKRQKRIAWKERFAGWWDGFGLVSRALREWQVLCELQDDGQLGPDPMAVGETDAGAFVLVRALPEAVDLPTLLAQRLCPRERREIAGRVGRAAASLHERGFSHPDLFAKHVFIHCETGTVRFVDFQRTRRHLQGVPWPQRCRDLAALNASLHPNAVSASERFRLLLAYLEQTEASAPPLVRILERWIGRRTSQLLTRPKHQRLRLQTVHLGSTSIVIAGQRLRVSPSRFALADTLITAEPGDA